MLRQLQRKHSRLNGKHSPSQGAGGGAQILLELALELGGKVVDQALIEVLSSQVGVTGGGLDLKDTLLNGQQGHIEGSTTLHGHKVVSMKHWMRGCGHKEALGQKSSFVQISRLRSM